MKRWFMMTALALTATQPMHADPAPVWKDYASTLVGVKMQVKREWQMVEIKETKETGTAAFNLSPHTTISVVRQSWGQPFEVWTSSDILTQIFKPGYTKTRAEFAGRKSVLVKGVALDGRTQQSYYSDHTPYVDEVSVIGPPDELAQYQEAIETVKKSIRWTR